MLGGLNSEPSVQPTALLRPSVVPCNAGSVWLCARLCSAVVMETDTQSLPRKDAERQLQKPAASMCQVPRTNSAAPVTPGNKRSCRSQKQEAIEYIRADQKFG